MAGKLDSRAASFYGARLSVLLSGCIALILGSAASADDGQRLEYNRDIRPILAHACFHCHGADKNQRQAELRLDIAEEATRDLGGRFAIVAGNPVSSEVVARVTHAEESERMPPADSERKLSPEQIATLTEWIAQGAEYQPHWSFIPPVPPALPDVRDARWPRNAIDRFILARLDAEGIAPSPEADRYTLIRRATLDLTGLPPTIEEVDAFVADESPDAYERLVNRLLASPSYGERMAQPWLDAARYADTNGYQNDGNRVMWRWRDWVIEAFNANLPFDRFTVEQLAGDLLPNPTLDQRIATGFNRNHRGNSEGGVIPEEYLVEYVVDRVDTTSTVWLGLTLGCTRCHDHKYDPFTQRDFYRLFAYFNNVPEKGRVVREGNSPPFIKSPTADQRRAHAKLTERLAQAEAEFAAIETEAASGQAAWEQSLSSGEPLDWTPDEGLVAHFRFDDVLDNAVNSTHPGTPQGGEKKFVPGQIGDAIDFDGARFVEAGNAADLVETERFSYGAWVFPRGERTGAILSWMDDELFFTGYDLHLEQGIVQVDIMNRILDDAIRVESVRPLEAGRWHHVLATYDGSKLARGVTLYIDGVAVPVKITNDTLNNPITAKTQPLRIGSRSTGGRFDGAIDDVRIYRRQLSVADAAILATPHSLTQIAALPAERRDARDALKLRECFLKQHAAEPVKSAYGNVQTLLAAKRDLEDSFPTTMVMQESATPHETFVLVRGEYDKPGDRVEPGTPGTLPSTPEGAPSSRLGLANWLVELGHPLTARVAVNRAWQQFFGLGLVKTTEDFGTQGELPSHPELLDWLATDFQAGGWDVKRLHRQILTSSAYRQSSRAAPDLLARDPENRLLARAPRIRLAAGAIRDQALAAGGLLVESLGGPSVKPFQPAGLWEELTAGGTGYTPDQGSALYRRSLYTHWKRTIAPPTMAAFDASPRETCVVRQSRTNTPLQALALLNDATFVEAAYALAQRAIQDGGSDPDSRLTHLVRRVLTRPPGPDELAILRAGFEQHLAEYQANPESAKEFVEEVGAIADPALDPCEQAAYTAVAGVILNLDEAITKE